MIQNLYEKRRKDFIDATNFIEPQKVPVGIEVTMWPFAYAGKTYAQVKDDPAETAKAYTAFLKDISLDYFMLGVGIFLDPEVNHVMGNYDYMIAEDGITIQHNQANMEFMKAEEYDDLINDYDNFRNNVLIRRSYPVFGWPREKAYEALKKAVILNWKLKQANNLIYDEINEREILLTLGYDIPASLTGFNQLFDLLRGMKDTFIDLRRRPDAVRKAADLINRKTRLPFNVEDYKNKSFPLGCMVYHSECFMSDEYFDEFFFKDFKTIYGPLMEAGVKYIIKGEGKFLRTLDRYRELPKGSVLFMLDQDDPFEAYEKIGDWQSLATGITVDLLKYGTKQKCIDYVKKCFDTFAPGGGFVFCPNKPLVSARDTNIDNLLAVYEFANEYGNKKERLANG